MKYFFQPLLLIFLIFGARLEAADQSVDVSPESDFFNCPIPVNVAGYINIYHMISAYSKCAGLNPELLLSDPLRAEVLNFGKYEVSFAESMSAETDPEDQVAGIRHSSWNKEIQLEIGLVFGFSVRFEGVPDTTEEYIDIHIIRPNNDPQDDLDSTDEIIHKSLTDGQVEWVLFQVTSAAEMIPGIWTFEVHQKGRVVAIKRFKLLL